MPFSVVIPSRSEANLRPCVEAIRKAGETCRIFVIDDGLPESLACNCPSNTECFYCINRPCKPVGGVKPFVFARNVNIGIERAGADDVILLNDDALLETPMGFTRMWEAARASLYGLVSATTNLAGNVAQHRHGKDGMRLCPSPTPGNFFATVAFVCVLIPRATILRIGNLDGRFTAYGWEDNDYCRRLHLAEMKLGIFDGCYVDHAQLQSTFRGEAYAAGDINAGRKIYMEKWGSM